jgi:hypothetical protein
MLHENETIYNPKYNRAANTLPGNDSEEQYPFSTAEF